MGDAGEEPMPRQSPGEGRLGRGKRMLCELCEGRRKLGMRVRRARALRSSRKQGATRHADLLNAIDHPRRRRILRMLHERGEPCNPIEIALKVEGPLGLIAYHVRVLKELGAVEQVGEEQEHDSAEHFYESRVEGDSSIEAMLEEDRGDDEDEDEEAENDEEGEEKS